MRRSPATNRMAPSARRLRVRVKLPAMGCSGAAGDPAPAGMA